VIASASLSEDVIVLFSNPVVVVTASLTSTPSSVNVIECLSDVNQPCLTLILEFSAQDAKYLNGETEDSDVGKQAINF